MSRGGVVNIVRALLTASVTIYAGRPKEVKATVGTKKNHHPRPFFFKGGREILTM